MPDEVDELILKMQHLEAQARAQREAQALDARGKSLRSRAQQVAWSAQRELSAAEAQQREGEDKLQRARDPGLRPIAAADLLEEGRRLTDDARTRVIAYETGSPLGWKVIRDDMPLSALIEAGYKPFRYRKIVE